MIELRDLEGHWRLERWIDDRRGGVTGRLSGRAVWADDGAGGLVRTEEGLLSYGSAPPMQATRRYLWRAAGDGALEVLFDDSRPFHRVTVSHHDRHFCAPDTYDVSYRFDAWPRWEQHWHVTGPRKDAVIRSVFSRVSEAVGSISG